MEPSSPTVWRRWIAAEMRRLREGSGRSQADAAEFLGCQVPKISLIEGGQRNIRDDDLQKLLVLYEVPESEWDYFKNAARRSREKGWWETYDDGNIPASLAQYLGLEQGAEQIRSYHPAIFHGLLQTPEYTAAVLEHSLTGFSPERIRRAASLRQRRQAVLWREEDPLRLSAVVDESALRRVLGGPEVMRAQLAHIVDIVSKYPNITVQLLPFDRGVISAAFSVLSFPWATDPGVVSLEQHGGATIYLDSIDEIDNHSYLFERLRAHALSPEESARMMIQAADGYAV